MILDKDLVLCHRAQSISVGGDTYYVPATTIQQNYIYDWVSKELLFELYNNALVNIHDYSSYTEEQEKFLIKAFFPSLPSDEGFMRFRSICLVSFSVIDRCYKVNFGADLSDLDGTPAEQLYCGMPYHIFRLYLGMYYDCLANSSNEDEFFITWSSDIQMDSVFYQLLSTLVHTALNSPGEIFESYEPDDIEEYLYEISDNMSQLIRNVDRNQLYLQRASQFVSLNLKGDISNNWVSKSDRILNCPLTRNMSYIISQCHQGIFLDRHPLMDSLGLSNIKVHITSFECKLSSVHDERTYILCPQVIGATYLAYRTTEDDYRFMYSCDESVGVHGELQEDIAQLYFEMDYNKVLSDVRELTTVRSELDRYEPLDYLDKGYLTRIVAVVFVKRSSMNKHPIPVGLVAKDFNAVVQRELVFIPFIGPHLDKLSDMEFIVEDGLPTFSKDGVSIVNMKEFGGKTGNPIDTIMLDIDVSQCKLNFSLIQQGFKAKAGMYSKTLIPLCFWDMECEILNAFEAINY